MKTDDVAGIFGVSIAVIIGIIITMGFLFAATLYSVFACGVVAMKLWLWFVVPIFGFKALTLVQAWGLAFFVGFLTHQLTFNTNKDERSDTEKITHYCTAITYPWMVLGMGWIIKTFIFAILI